ncbi:MAG: rod-binding protein [Candidatus Acidiferrum sp.]
MIAAETYVAGASGYVKELEAIHSQNGTTGASSKISNSPEDRKLRAAAGEFEGMLLSSLWKSMKSTFATPDDDDSNDPAHDTLEDMGMQAMSNAVGKAGGLGLGKLILKHLEPALEKAESQKVDVSGKGSAAVADIQ